MEGQKETQALRVALIVVGAIFVVGVFALMQLWPAAWRWQPSQPEYEQMFVGVYATLGIFLWIAARDPLRHLSLIWFAAWSSVVHGGIMGVQAMVDASERAHFYGDIPGLIIVGLVLGLLARRATTAASAASVPGS